jgi:lipoprotein-anchoring transpeptidase ErfK/SrfK
MIKLSYIFTGALVAASVMVADWATAAPLSLSHNLARADQMAPLQEESDQGYQTPAQFRRQVVAYNGSEAAGTVIIDTPNTFLYLVMGNGRALRYGIGVGRDGFRWSGVQQITKKAEWPDWTPPAEMIARQPYLPRFMAGGPTNPLGARAMYLGNTIYRIHGTNAPSTIGQRVSSGCIRLTNEDVIDLASRVNVGTKVVVINGDYRAEAPMMSAPASLRPMR